MKGKRRSVRVCPKAKPKTPTAKNVSMRLDTAHAGRATIGAAGGTLTAAEPDGTRYTLAIPAGALADEKAISVTPLASAATARGVRLVGGAQFAPEGLAFAKPATLTIDVPRGSTARLHGFAWFGVGRNVHRYPVRASGRRLILRVAHFSGVGAASGADDWLPKAVSALTIQYGRYIRPAMRRAETDDSQIESAFNAAFGWQHEVEVAGLQERFKTWREEIRTSYEKAIRNARREGDRSLRGRARPHPGRAPVLRSPAPSSSSTSPCRAQTRSTGPCGARGSSSTRRSWIRMEQGDTSIEHHVSLRGLPITMGVGLVLSGTKTYDYVSARTNLPCSMQAHPVAPFSVNRLELPLAAKPDGTPPPREVELELVLGQAQATITCGDTTNPINPYHDLFRHLHADERKDSAYSIRAWEWIGGAVVARKSYDRTLPIEGGAAVARADDADAPAHAQPVGDRSGGGRRRPAPTWWL